MKIPIPHISSRLNLMVVCEIVLVLVLSLAVMLYFSRQALKDEARSDAEQTLEGTVQHIDNILMTVEQTTYNIYQDVQWHLDQPDRMETYCRNIVETYPYIVGCAIAFKPHYYAGHDLFMTYVHRKGYKEGDNTLVTADHFGTRPYTEQVWYKLPMKTGRACWTEPLPEEENEGVTLSFCLPITDRNNRCVGVVAVDLPVSLLSQIIHAAKPSPNSYSVMLSGNGSYIVHPDTEKLSGMGTALETVDKYGDSSAREAAEAMMSGQTGHKVFRLNKRDWYVFYKPFCRANTLGMPMETTGWSAGVVFLEDDILGPHNILSYTIVVITILSLLVFFLLCRMLIRRQLKPLQMLTRSARRVAEGHYDETVPNAQRDDEIGQLQDHFQLMQQSLAARSSELEQMTSMLKVRGEELRKAYGNAQGSDRMKTTFLHYMTTQMTMPADLIERSVMKLCNNYQDMSTQEADYETGVVKKQSDIVLDLLDHMVEALKIEAEEAEKGLKAGKELSHE